MVFFVTIIYIISVSYRLFLQMGHIFNYTQHFNPIKLFFRNKTLPTKEKFDTPLIEIC